MKSVAIAVVCLGLPWTLGCTVDGHATDDPTILCPPYVIMLDGGVPDAGGDSAPEQPGWLPWETCASICFDHGCVLLDGGPPAKVQCVPCP